MDPHLNESLTSTEKGQPVPERQRHFLKVTHTGHRDTTKEQPEHAKLAFSGEREHLKDVLYIVSQLLENPHTK